MRHFSAPPSFANEDDTRVAQQLHAILWTWSVAIAVLGILEIVMVPAEWFRLVLMILSVNAISLALHSLSKRGQPRWASRGLIVSLGGLVPLLALTAGGIESRAAWLYPLLVFMAGMLLGARAGLITAATCSLITLGLTWAEVRGLLPASSLTLHPLDFWAVNTLYLAIALGLQYLASRSIERSLQNARRELHERQQAEAAMRRTNAYNRSLLEASLDVLVALATDGRVTDLNSAAEQVLGSGRAELIGADIRDFFLEREALGAGLQQALEKGTARDMELNLRSTDGRVRQVLCNATVYLNEAGQTAGIFVAARDITERKRAEASLRETQQLYESLFRLSPEVIVLTTLEGRYLAVNQAYERVTGHRTEEVVGRTVAEIGAWETPLKRQEMLQRLHDQGEVHNQETRFRRRAGDFYTVLMSMAAVEMNGRPCIISVLTDISDRKLMEEDLRASKVRFGTVFRCSPSVLTLSTLEEGRLVEVNDAFVRVTGYQPEEAIGRTSTGLGLLAPDDRLELRRQVETQGRVEGYESTYRPKSGEVRHGLLSAELIPLDGHLRLLIGMQDITERKQAEALIQAQNEQLQAQNEALVRQEQLLRRTDAELRQVNAELERRVADRTRELSALYLITAAVNEASSPDHILAQALPLALEAVGCASGRLYVIDENTTRPRLVVVQPAGAPASGDAEMVLTSLVSEVLSQNKPVLVPAAADASALGSATDNLARGAYVGAPLRAAEQVLGVLCVHNENLEQMTLEVMSLLEAMGERIGLALENFRLRSQSLQLAVLQERQRLARDLHDSVTQQVYSLLLFASRAKKALRDADVAVAGQQIRRIEEVAQQTLKELRLLIFELRPLALAQVGLVVALQQRLESVERRVGVTARLSAEGELALAPQTEEAVYYIAVEALNNSLKHASASAITVSLGPAEGALRLEVADNGQGFDPEAQGVGGSGLANMRARAQALGAALEIRSAPGQGTNIRLDLEVRHG